MLTDESSGTTALPRPITSTCHAAREIIGLNGAWRAVVVRCSREPLVASDAMRRHAARLRALADPQREIRHGARALAGGETETLGEIQRRDVAQTAVVILLQRDAPAARH